MPQPDPTPSAAPGTAEFNSQLSMRLKELGGSMPLEPEPELPAPAPVPAQPAGPRMSMREAKSETAKAQAAIASLTPQIKLLRADSTRLRTQAGLSSAGAPPAAAAQVATGEEQRSGLGRVKSKDAMQTQVLEIKERQAALEKEAQALQEENKQLRKRILEQGDKADLLEELVTGGDSAAQGASGKASSSSSHSAPPASREEAAAVDAPPAPPFVAAERGAGSSPPSAEADSARQPLRGDHESEPAPSGCRRICRFLSG